MTKTQTTKSCLQQGPFSSWIYLKRTKWFYSFGFSEIKPILIQWGTEFQNVLTCLGQSSLTVSNDDWLQLVAFVCQHKKWFNSINWNERHTGQTGRAQLVENHWHLHKSITSLSPFLNKFPWYRFTEVMQRCSHFTWMWNIDPPLLRGSRLFIQKKHSDHQYRLGIAGAPGSLHSIKLSSHMAWHTRHFNLSHGYKYI